MCRRLVILLLACACDGGSGFAGDYETTSFARGSCGATQDEAVPGNEQFFRLGDVDALVAYYACTALGRCDDQYDLTRSFGAAKDGATAWAGYLATAIPGATCTLTYRVRRLSHGDHGLQIDTDVYRATDDTLTGSACSQDAAAARGTAMPCVEQSQLVAEDR